MGRAPFLRMALLLSAGIAAYLMGANWGKWGYAVFVLAAVSYAGFFFWHRTYPSDIRNLLLSASGDFVCVLFGYMLCLAKDPLRQPSHLIYHDQAVAAFTATVRSPPQRKPYGYRAEVEVDRIWKEEGSYPVHGSMYLSVRDSSGSLPLPGTRLALSAQVNRIEGKALEGMFDFARYAAYQRVYHQSTAKAGEWKIIGTSQGYGLLRASAQARHFADSVLSQYLRTAEAKGMLSALLLGVKDHLSEEMKTTFGDTGAMHVLAVSGLHVGILFMLVTVLIKPFEKRRAILRTGLVVAIVILWCYAFVTGLSASVLRSVLMFSVVLMGQVLGRKGYVLNGLAISALLLLCYEPYYLTSVGFQLSYLAVLGIVWLQPMLVRLWEPNHAWLRYWWELTCVSIAAQAATCVLGVFYFHQFPLYFLFSNWVVIPVAGFLLITGFALVLLSWIPGVGVLCAMLLDGTVWLVHALLKSLASLPYSTIEPLYLNGVETLLLLVVLTGCMSFFSTMQRAYLWVALLASFGFAAHRVQWLQFHHSNPSTRLTASLGSVWFTSTNHHSVLWQRWNGTYLPSKDALTAHAAALGRVWAGESRGVPQSAPFKTANRTWIYARTQQDIEGIVKQENTVWVISTRWKGKVTLPEDVEFSSLTLIFESARIPYAWRKSLAIALAKGARMHRLPQQGSFVVQG